jgi:hypothetical protein
MKLRWQRQPSLADFFRRRAAHQLSPRRRLSGIPMSLGRLMCQRLWRQSPAKRVTPTTLTPSTSVFSRIVGEVYRVLKPGGILAFTFHHSEDEPWVGVLESLFEAGFYLEATYPIRGDEQ